LLGGGALLQNCSEHGNRSLAYYLALAMLARLLGCPWYIVAGGIGPIRGRLPRLWTGFVVRTARDISVRDTPSRDLLCSLGILSRRIRCEQDPVCTVTPISRDKVSSLLRRCSIPDENGTILCVAPHGRMTGVEAMIELIRQRKREGAFPLFFAFDLNEDLMLCRRLQALCGGAVFPTEGLADEKDLPEACIAGVFEQSRAVFTGRLHALILARIANTPTTIFPPDTGDKKITAFANGDR
jgi:polysaccharide pyruvyl transferase WcaK-like protein